MMESSATEQIGDRIETALYACETAPYSRLDLKGLSSPHWTISLVIEGHVALLTGGHSFSVRPGVVMIHPPNIPFDEINAGPGLHLWLACEARIHDPHPENVLDRYPLYPVVTLSRDLLAAYRGTFTRLESVHASGNGSGVGRLRQSALITELLSILIEAWEEGGAVARPAELSSPVGRFAPVIAYLRKNLAERITRSDLAAIAALHPTAFDRAFVRATGQTPVRLLMEMRLSEVRRRLETTDETLETIARAAGLADATHLSRLFRARFGMAPGKWRDGVSRARSLYLPSATDRG